ncbi:MAG TPA: twin-arginine translocation signal domain-containing protein [Caldilineaceae bacterium]|nr:twin-arginine translocation signal domain-containing protein [Caldilineaceae bacterium]
MASSFGKYQLSRREFLKYTELLGVAALTAPWLVACGAPRRAGREW